MPTAALLIVGDEILTAKFVDENGPWLLRRLRELGADARRVVLVPDDVDEIADEVRRALRFDHVVTTGGVGPTHDDRTFEGVARGLDRPLVLEPALVAILEALGLAKTPTNLRMCTVPAGSVLVPAGRVPVVRAGPVWVFPGVPGLVRHQFDQVADAFRGQPVVTTRRSTARRETDIAAPLAAVADAHPAVQIGSYPRWSDALREVEVVITLESRDPDALAAAVGALDDVL